MDRIAVTMAKLAGLHKIVRSRLDNPRARYFDPVEVREHFEDYDCTLVTLKEQLPHLFADVPDRPILEFRGTTDFDGRGYIQRHHLERIVRDIDYILEVRSRSELKVPAAASAKREIRVFISHGRALDWREAQAFIEKDLGIPTLELAQEPNRGRSVLQKLAEESDRCCYAVVVMTGDDKAKDGQQRTRENVMHEIGYFQAKFGLANVCLLHEEGVSIPSNIHGLVYIPFPPGMISVSFGVLGRELRAAFE